MAVMMEGSDRCPTKEAKDWLEAARYRSIMLRRRCDQYAVVNVVNDDAGVSFRANIQIERHGRGEEDENGEEC